MGRKGRRGVDGRSKWIKRRSKHTPKHRDNVILRTVQDRLSDILLMDLKDMPHLISQFTGEDSVFNQYSVIEVCLKRIFREISLGIDRSPHSEQVRTIRRLVYGKGDILLIARTGFGKSLILYSFSVLTGKIIIQLTSLNKLGKE
jgi:hypothetical protein